VIDPNPRAGMMRDRAAFVVNFERIAATSLLTKVGDEDAELLYGIPLGDLVDRLRFAGAAHVLATAGRNGAEIVSAVGRVVTPIADLPGEIVDTMGAGDATLAATVHALVTTGIPKGLDAWKRVLEQAMLIAGLTCRTPGALLQLPPVPDTTGRIFL
jgi:fructokinase